MKWEKLNECINFNNMKHKEDMTMTKFRKRPLEIEAVQYTGSNLTEMEKFVGGRRRIKKR